MPELPEVETIARALSNGGRGAPSILGKEISGAQILWLRTLETPITPQNFNDRLNGQIVESIKRRGKFLVIQLTDDLFLIHLRMSGDLRVEPVSSPVQPHDRMIIDFRDGSRLVFNDTRKFGRVWLVSKMEEVTSKLGIEPFDTGLTKENFFELLQGRKRQLKPLLLDQSFIAGLGNIYADEALFHARLHPLRLASSLSSREAEDLLEAIRRVLGEGIERQGASIDWVYRGGDFQNHFSVYQRTGEACPRCGTPVERIIVGQRSTHYCPNCQRLE